MIEYKGKEEGIKTKEIPPQYTSQKCPKCGKVSKSNRDGVDFHCIRCGYTNHADFIGAWNIATRGGKPLEFIEKPNIGKEYFEKSIKDFT